MKPNATSKIPTTGPKALNEVSVKASPVIRHNGRKRANLRSLTIVE